MAILYKGFPQYKRGISAWAPNAKNDLTREPMYIKALPFTQYHFYQKHEGSVISWNGFIPKVKMKQS